MPVLPGEGDDEECERKGQNPVHKNQELSVRELLGVPGRVLRRKNLDFFFFFILREDTHVFLVVGALRVYPPYTNGFVVHATSQSLNLSNQKVLPL